MNSVSDTSASLKISEIFFSLQGETNLSGLPTVFIRLTGCPLRCEYCDTAYAFHGGTRMSLEDILAQVGGYRCRHVTVTGGEPLAQKDCLLLLRRLCDAGFTVSLETSGAIDVSGVDARVIKIVDIKTPASGEMAKNLLSNLQHLSARDQLKWVICDRNDYEWSKQFIQQYALQGKLELLFSPSYQQLEARQLADWILEDRLDVRFQLQLHKQLWGNEPGR